MSVEAMGTPVQCTHCGAVNLVAICATCGKPYVVTGTATEQHLPDETPVLPKLGRCRVCVAKELGESVATVNAGLQQRTCQSCHTEFLSLYGL